MSAEVQVAPSLYFINVESRHRKTANAFGIFRASVSAIITSVRHAITQNNVKYSEI